MNKALFKRSMFFLKVPYPKVPLLNTPAESYLFKIIQDEEADIVINIDEDVIDLDKLTRLLQYCTQNEYVNCGIPDEGMVDIRKLNPVVKDPFKNILNTKEIRKKFSIDAINSYCSWKNAYHKYFPVDLL